MIAHRLSAFVFIMHYYSAYAIRDQLLVKSAERHFFEYEMESIHLDNLVMLADQSGQFVVLSD